MSCDFIEEHSYRSNSLRECEQCEKHTRWLKIPNFECEICELVIEHHTQFEKVCEKCYKTNERDFECIGCGEAIVANVRSEKFKRSGYSYMIEIDKVICRSCSEPFGKGRNKEKRCIDVMLFNLGDFAYFTKYNPDWPTKTAWAKHLLKMLTYTISISERLVEKQITRERKICMANSHKRMAEIIAESKKR
jgi:hypothetical protein